MKISITVADDGVGLSDEKMRELENKPHYMESVDERLDLRHGLGLLLVRRIVGAHGGTVEIARGDCRGVEVVMTFAGSDLLQKPKDVP